MKRSKGSGTMRVEGGQANGAPAGGREIRVIDTTLRDAHQCLWATRMTTQMMTPIVSRIDKAGYA